MKLHLYPLPLSAVNASLCEYFLFHELHSLEFLKSDSGRSFQNSLPVSGS